MQFGSGSVSWVPASRAETARGVAECGEDSRRKPPPPQGTHLDSVRARRTPEQRAVGSETVAPHPLTNRWIRSEPRGTEHRHRNPGCSKTVATQLASAGRVGRAAEALCSTRGDVRGRCRDSSASAHALSAGTRRLRAPRLAAASTTRRPTLVTLHELRPNWPGKPTSGNAVRNRGRRGGAFFGSLCVVRWVVNAGVLVALAACDVSPLQRDDGGPLEDVASVADTGARSAADAGAPDAADPPADAAHGDADAPDTASTDAGSWDADVVAPDGGVADPGWVEVPPRLEPEPRYAHMGAYDPDADRLVVVGGMNGQIGGPELSDV